MMREQSENYATTRGWWLIADMSPDKDYTSRIHSSRVSEDMRLRTLIFSSRIYR